MFGRSENIPFRIQDTYSGMVKSEGVLMIPF